MTVRHLGYSFARDPDGSQIVPSNPLILSYFRCQYCWELTHSDQAIGYVWRYCTTNSDAGKVEMGPVGYEGHRVQSRNKLKYDAAARIASACECFAAICGFWRYDRQSTMRSLGIHLRNQVVLASGQREALEQVDVPSPLERYLKRPEGEIFNCLIFVEYYALYSVESKASRAHSLPANGEP
jgi:hypothetical protein